MESSSLILFFFFLEAESNNVLLHGPAVGNLYFVSAKFLNSSCQDEPRNQLNLSEAATRFYRFRRISFPVAEGMIRQL